jgi:hypothetical protein
VWLRKVCSTVVVAACSSMTTVTLWLTIASGGSFLSSGMSNPAALAGPALARASTNTGRAYRRNRMAHLHSQRVNGSASADAPVIMTRGGGKAIGRTGGCYEGVTAKVARRSAADSGSRCECVWGRKQKTAAERRATFTPRGG